MAFPPPPPASSSSSTAPRPPRYTAGAWADSPSASSRQIPTRPTPIPVPANPKSVLWVARLPSSISDADLRATFSAYGHLTRITISTPRPNSPTTYAHISFRSPQEAAAALQALNGRFPTLLSGSAQHNGVRPAAPMRIEYEGEYRTSGLFRAPATPEPARLSAAPPPSAGLPVKPEPDPSPHKAPPPPPTQPAAGPSRANGAARAPLPSQETAAKRGAANQAAKKRLTRKRLQGQQGQQGRPQAQFAEVEDAIWISPPTIRYVDTPLVALGLGKRTLSSPSDPPSTPAVTYACWYRLPAALPPDASNPRTIAFARTARDELALEGVTLHSWEVVVPAPKAPPPRPHRSSQPTRADPSEPPHGEQPLAPPPPPPSPPSPPPQFRARLVVPPEMVRERSRDTPAMDCRRRAADAKRERELRREGVPDRARGAGRAGGKERAGEGEEEGVEEEEEEGDRYDAADGSRVLRVALPPSCVGSGADVVKARRAWLGAQARALALEGKAVLATKVDEEARVCEVRYLPPEDEAEGEGEGEGEGEEEGPPAEEDGGAQGAQGEMLPPPPLRPQALERAEVLPVGASMDEDVKPVIARSPPPTAPAPNPQPPRMDVDGDAEVDQLATPTPEPEGSAAAAEARRFPLAMRDESTADSDDTRKIVDGFLKEYFRRFDESRGTLEYLYTPNALFSLKLDPTVPARLPRQRPPTPFDKRWLVGANRVSSTPVAITNAIRLLPPGSHDLARARYTALSVPELHVRKQQPLAPLVVHLVGQFEEFPEKTLRGFSRTFIIVPKGAGAGGGTAEYWIHSDQLTLRYFVPGEPRTLPVAFPQFSPSKAGAAPRQAVAGGLSQAGRAPAPAASGAAASSAAARPFAQLQPHPGLARMQGARAPAAAPPPASRPAAARQPPAAAAPARPAPAALPAPAPQPHKRRRASSASPGPLRPTAAAAAAAATAATDDDTDADMHDDVLVLTDSSASRSPTPVPSPAKQQQQQHAPRGNKRRAAESPDPAVASGGSSKRRVSGAGPAASSGGAAAAAEAGLSRAEVERLIQLEVAAQVQRLTAAAGAAGGRAVSPRSDAEVEEPGAVKKRAREKERAAQRERERERDEEETRAVAREKRKQKEAQREREKEKERRDKEKKEKERKEKEKRNKAKEPELGTGLGKTDARILIPGGGNAQLHGFDGRGNKLRHMVDTGSSLLAVSHVGDIVEFACHATSLASTVRKLHSSKDDKFRVDDFAWSEAKETLLVGYLGAKEGKELVRPAHQVILYRREETPSGSALVPMKLDERPHTAGGVTAIVTLPGAGRLRFITGGEDKKLFLWTRSRATQDIKTANIRSEHSSMITSIAPIVHQDWVVSGGKDKRVFAYDLDRMASTWQALLHSPVMTVSQVTSDPHLILARVSAPSSQFTVFDIRSSKKGVLQFGYDLAPHTSATGALSPTTMGRYYRGDQCDTVYAFPDYDSGVKLWDLRNVRSTLLDRDLKKQHLNGLARSKVVQTVFRGRGELDLLEVAHFSRLSIRG